MAVLESSGPRVIENAEGLRTTPSSVTFLKQEDGATEDESTLVAINAKKVSVQFKENSFYGLKYFFSKDLNMVSRLIKEKRFPYNVSLNDNVKDVISSSSDIILDNMLGKQFNPVDSSAMFIKYCKEQADGLLGKNIKKCVLAIPSFLDNENSKKDLKDSLNIVGLEPIAFIDESKSSIIAYEAQKNNNVLVFNLGGTGFSLTYLERKENLEEERKEKQELKHENNSDAKAEIKEDENEDSDDTETPVIKNPLKEVQKFEIKFEIRDNFLGGEDIDKIIIDILCKEFHQKNKIDITKEPSAMQRISEAAEKAKIELTLSSQVEINLPFLMADHTGPKHLLSMITRSKFERYIDDFTTKVKKHCDQMKNKINDKEIDQILLIGGISRIPCIQDIIKQVFKKEPNRSLNPEEAPTIGACIIADSLKSISEEKVSFEKLPLSIGIETLGGRFSKIIERGVSLPTSQKLKLLTNYDNQPVINISFFMGERELAEDNKLLGNMKMDLPLSKRGELAIEVHVVIDEFGNMSIKLTETTLTKKSVSYSVDLNNGLNPEILEDVLEVSKKFKEVDELNASNIELRTEIDSFLYALNTELSNIKKSYKIELSQEMVNEETKDSDNSEFKKLANLIKASEKNNAELEELIAKRDIETDIIMSKYQEVQNIVNDIISFKESQENKDNKN